MDKQEIVKTILEALRHNYSGEMLRQFVQRSTKCSLREFEDAYDEVVSAWLK